MSLAKSGLINEPNLIRSKYHYSVTDIYLLIDLDETVIHTYDSSSPPNRIQKHGLDKYPQLQNRLYAKTIRVQDSNRTYSTSRFWGSIRPHTDTFMNFADTYFAGIIVWTAGVFPYGREMANEISRGINSDRIFMTRRDCTFADGTYIKSAKTLANKFGIDPSKILYLDDREESFCETPNQGIQIPRYEPPDNPSAILLDDPTLLQLIAWLSTEEALKATTAAELVRPGLFTHSVNYYQQRQAAHMSPRFKLPRLAAPAVEEIVLENPYY